MDDRRDERAAREQLVGAHGDIHADAAGDQPEPAREREFQQDDRIGEHAGAGGQLVHQRPGLARARRGEAERQEDDAER